MLQPRPPAKPPNTHYLAETEPIHLPTSVLVLKSLGQMRPAVACTLILTAAGLIVGAIVAIVALVVTLAATVAAVAGTVAISAVSLAVIVLVLRAGPPSSRRP
jgi:hypothetical protein